jgi:hypothetical protein
MNVVSLDERETRYMSGVLYVDGGRICSMPQRKICSTSHNLEHRMLVHLLD